MTASGEDDIAVELIESPTAAELGETMSFRVAVVSIDTEFVNAPTVGFELPDDVGSGSLPAECEVQGRQVSCMVAPALSDQITLPHSSDPFPIALDVLDAFSGDLLEITITAESFGNPLSNDAEPGNNVVTMSVEIDS